QEQALPLAPGLLPPPDDPGGQDAGVVQDQQVARIEQVGQVAEVVMANLTRRSVHDEQARGVAFRGRLLGDQVRGQVVIEQVREHCLKRVPALLCPPPPTPARPPRSTPRAEPPPRTTSSG